MSGRPVARPFRLALRIWLVTVAAVLAAIVALARVVHLSREQPAHPHPVVGFARYAAAKVAARWPAAAAVREELELLRAEGHLAGAAYRWDGTLVAAAPAHGHAEPDDAAADRGEPLPPPPPLSPEERDELARTGVVERRQDGARRPSVALPVGGGSDRGYVVFDPPPPPPRPRPPGVLPIVLLLGVLGVAAALLGSSIARPLDRLAQAARALGSGDLTARTGLSRRDELGAVARAFDEMAERLVGLLRGQTELIANVAHELRTPLARIRVALDLAAEGDAEVARESLAEIGEDLSELERLVNDILASARMDLARNTTGTGAPPLHLAPLEVEALVAGAAERLRQRHPARTLALELEPGLPAVEGDAVLLRRALDNLVDNARKYSAPDAEIRVRGSRRGEQVVLEVVDRGEGIAPEDLARLFTPFFRADPSRARATGGVGLGLALARRIVEAHGGTLTAESAPGRGTTMRMALPVMAAGRDRGQGAPAEPARRSG